MLLRTRKTLIIIASAVIVTAIILLSVFASVAKADGFVFGTNYSIRLRWAPSAVKIADAKIHEIDEAFSTSIATSDIARINNSDAYEPITVAWDTIMLIKLCFDFYKQYPEFNIAIRPLVELWHFDSLNYLADTPYVPSDTEIAEALTYACPDMFILDLGACVVTKKDKRAKLDLGGAVNGYEVGKIKDITPKAARGIADIGGNIGVFGTAKIGIKDPRGSELCATFTAKDTVVATSGDYERYYLINGNRYAHIIGSDGKPANLSNGGIISTTVVCADGTMSDILSTYIFIAGYDAGASVAKQYGASFIIFTENSYKTFGEVQFEAIKKFKA